MEFREAMEQSLKDWLESNLPKFLSRINDEVGNELPWEMPIVEDYVLVVAVKDFKDGLGGIFCIGDSNVPAYRVRGLLADALNT